MKMTVHLPGEEYDILAGHGMAARAGEVLALNRRVLVVTDDGVPPAYAARVCEDCAHPVPVCLPAGEASKSMDGFATLLRAMTDAGFTRTDAVVAVGGGVVGDLSGFAASCYMRGVDFYNIPTTLLSQVDSSVGGKTAINFAGIKNIVGSFYQPKRVLIDPDLLDTLPPRQFSNGMAEIVKMAMTSDAGLLSLLEAEGVGPGNLLTVICRALDIKRKVVEQDEKESGLRRILNFGHTLGHGIESAEGLTDLLHGECVALGMIPMTAPALRERLCALLARFGLPTRYTGDLDRALAAVVHDKKKSGDELHYVYVSAPGQCEIRHASVPEFSAMVREAFV